MAGCSGDFLERKHTMERKGGSAAVVTAEAVTTALKSRVATQEEEKVLRMRYGARVDTQSPLPRAAGANAELADELLVIELQLFKAMRASRRPHLVSVPSERNAAKDKIVRSLKSRKK